MSNEKKPTVHHTDAVHPGSGSDPIERAVPVNYTPLSDGHADRFSGELPGELQISHPIEAVEDFEHRQHLLAVLAASNDEGLPGVSDDRGGGGFDAAILSMVEHVLAVEGVSLSDVGVPARYVKAFYVDQAHGFDSRPTFVSYLEDNEETLRALGFDEVKDQSTFARQFTRLRELEVAESVTRASTRAVYAIYRYYGRDSLPAARAEELAESPRIDEGDISRATEREVIRNWVRYLLPRVLESFSFNRGDNTSLPVDAFFGAIALAAAHDTNISQAKELAGWHYDSGSAPGKSNLWSQISQFDITEVSRVFDGVHDRFLGIVGEFGVFDGPLDVAVDATEIPYWGEETEWTIGQRRANNSSEHWRYVALVGAENRARFAFGVRPLQTKNMAYPQLRSLLHRASAHTELGYVFGDRGFHAGEAVEAIRPFVGDRWIIKAGEQSDDIKALLDEAPPGESVPKEGAGLKNVSPPPNAFAVPVSDDAVGGRNRDHEAFITDLPVEDVDLKGLQFKFHNEWNIERGFKQQKADFLPRTNSRNANYRLFLMNTAILLYNIHTLINRAPSPKFGVRLDVSAQMVLKGVYDVAFS